MIQTQLIRLDAPYNVICAPRKSEFGLHIATLMVINEPQRGKAPEVHCYPVVAKKYEVQGEPWMKFELNDCIWLAEQNGSATLRGIKRVMEACHRSGFVQMITVPYFINNALYIYNIDVEDRGKKSLEQIYTVELRFGEAGNEGEKIVYSTPQSDFFFYEVFTEKQLSSRPFTMNTKEVFSAIDEMRTAYIDLLYSYGLQSIRFVTKDKRYQEFVEELNKKVTDEG